MIAAAVAMALLAAGPAAADFAAGLRAYDAGDYTTAVAEWWSLAEAGDPVAQAALADLYASGLGVPRDDRRAAAWYRRAAGQGLRVAQLNLGDMYARGRGVPADPVAAYVWLALAARQGSDWAAVRRDDIAATMTTDQIEEAARRLAD